MGEYRNTRQYVANIRFNTFEETVSTLNSPSSGDENMHGDESSGARLTGAQRMILYSVAHIGLYGVFHKILLVIRQCCVHETQCGHTDDTHTGPDDVGCH